MRQVFLDFIRDHKISLSLLCFGALYVCFVVLIHDVTIGDFQVFVKEPESVSYGIDRWFNWSSRLLIESSVAIFSKHLLLWKIVSIVMGAILFWSLGRILRIKRVYQGVLLLCMIFLINMHILASAGVFATTINYLWPAACFAFVMSVALIPPENKYLNRIAQVLMWPLYIYAVCSEQLAVLGLIFVSTYIIYKIYKKQHVSIVFWILLGISIIGILNVIISPGNENRKASEIGTWWPGFDSLSLLYKIKIGIIVMFSRLFMAPELPAVLLVLLLGVYSYKMRIIQAFVIILPAIIIILLFIFPDTFGTTATSSRSPNFFNELSQRTLTLEPKNLPTNQMINELFVVFGVIAVGIVTSIVLLSRRHPWMIVILYFLSAGFLVSFAVSFSPTVFASNTRTLYPFLIIIACVNYYLLNKLISKHFSSGSEIKTRIRSK